MRVLRSPVQVPWKLRKISGRSMFGREAYTSDQRRACGCAISACMLKSAYHHATRRAFLSCARRLPTPVTEARTDIRRKFPARAPALGIRWKATRPAVPNLIVPNAVGAVLTFTRVGQKRHLSGATRWAWRRRRAAPTHVSALARRGSPPPRAMDWTISS